MSAFSGQSAQRAEALVARLDSLGICCVRVGELEHFAPAIGVSKGPAWLPAALNAEAHRKQHAQDQAIRLCQAGGLEQMKRSDPGAMVSE